VNTILTAGPVRPICSPTTSLHDFENIPRQVCPPTTSLHVFEIILRRLCPPTTSRHLFECIQMLVCPPTTSRQHNIIRGSLNLVPLQCTGDTLKIFRIRCVLTRAVISLKIFRARDLQFFSFFIEFNYYCLIVVPPQSVDQGYL
jgi:hypothetical protein